MYGDVTMYQLTNQKTITTRKTKGTVYYNKRTN